MILIISKRFDHDTNAVIEWLSNHYNKRFLRLDSEDNFKVHTIDAEGKVTYSKDEEESYFYPELFNSYWYRREAHNSGTYLANKEAFNQPIFHDHNKYHIYHIREEFNVFSEYMYNTIEGRIKNKLGSKFNASLNKLLTLNKAKSFGLQVPNSYLFTEKKEVLKRIRKGQKFITKALSDGVYLFTKEYAYYSYTEKIDEKTFFNKLPDVFFPSLFQERLTKKYELRIFYLKGTFYAMAIFSQFNKETEIDSRKATNRSVPYLLPDIVQSQLLNLMHALNLNTGSIDMIVDLNNNYFFLEVNPVGQIGMVSAPCNYYLEKEIAEILINYE